MEWIRTVVRGKLHARKLFTTHRRNNILTLINSEIQKKVMKEHMMGTRRTGITNGGTVSTSCLEASWSKEIASSCK